MTTSTLFTIPRAIALTGLAYAVYETRRLVARYPIQQGSSALAQWPDGVGAPYEVCTRTRLPAGADPRETFVTAFYATWTLRVEDFLYRNFMRGMVIEPPPLPAAEDAPQAPESEFESASARPLSTPCTPPPTPVPVGTASADVPAYASGLFPVIGRSAESTMVWWGSVKGAGGAQLLTCTRVPGSETDVTVSFACAETNFLKEGSVDGWIGTKFHRMYMRYLLDRAAVRMDKWATADSRQYTTEKLVL
ncbi:hypothetical protein CspeluHIS016_0207410 [Cutaneotrichosporon spelunceum]|uniref:Uncharacterized protein n=1 Tax=Cutaneotrichosporon spelunceum TaxID=1672016 RepID=A0AAD3YA60_9TREE|nr:hypothetical protein CspeluHIS016_0207410 [Cutaneotrichosporon spelunceum]